MKKLLKGSTDRFVLNLLKGAGMILPCTLVASCGNSGKDSNKGGDQKGSFVDKEEMIKFFIDNKKLSRGQAGKKVTGEFFEENKDNQEAFEPLTRENLLKEKKVGKVDFAAAAKKCIEAENIGALKESLKILNSGSADLFKEWDAIEGDKFRKNLNLKLDKNKLSWGDKSFDNVKNNLKEVVDVLVAYNTIFPGNTVRFVLDETNIDLSAANIVDSLTELVKLGANIEGEIWVGKSRGGDKFGFCLKSKSASVGEWENDIDGLGECIDLVAQIKEIEGIGDIEVCSSLFESVKVSNGTNHGKIKGCVGDFIVDDCVDFGSLGDFEERLAELESAINFVGTCFTWSIDNNNDVYLKVGDCDPMKILCLDSEDNLRNLGKLIAGTEKWFVVGDKSNKIGLYVGDAGEVGIGKKKFVVDVSSKDSFDKFVYSLSNVGKCWPFIGNFGDLEIKYGSLCFGALDISGAGREKGFFVDGGSWEKAVNLGIVGKSSVYNVIKGENSYFVGVSGMGESYKFDEKVWIGNSINSSILGRYFVA